MKGRVSHSAIPVISVVIALYTLSSRYYTSASYERPIHLAVLTLLLTSCLSALLARYTISASWRLLNSQLPWHTPSDSPSRTAWIPSALSSRPGLCCYFLVCIILRTFAFWLVIRTTQCAVPGIEAFLPLFVILCEILNISPPRLLSPSTRTAATSTQIYRRQTLFLCIASLFWGLISIQTLTQARTATSTICPAGWHWRPLITLALVAICFLDATMIVSISDLHRHEFDDVAALLSFLSPVLLVSAICIFLVSFPTLLHDSRLFWTFCPHLSDVRDLAIDSFLSAVIAVCSIYLLDVLHPSTLALLLSSLGLFGFHLFRPETALLLPPTSLHPGLFYLTGATCGLLLYLTLYQMPTNANTPEHPLLPTIRRWLLNIFISVCILSQALTLLLPHTTPIILPTSQAITQLISTAETRASRWTTQASKSKTLSSAILEYKRRYGIPPPPNFDKWYAFATAANSPVIDDFDQIHQDLLPFWGMKPAEIRSRTAEILTYGSVGMGGLRIRNGTVEQSPYVAGSHRWMLESLERMIGPFARWLPDMDLAINLGDECRMAVPHEDMKAYKARALDARDRMLKTHHQSAITNLTKPPQWPAEFPKPLPSEIPLASFSKNPQWQLFYDFIAPTCPPTSPARNTRWWDWSTSCPSCITPHSLLTHSGPLIADSILANDLCHQPDLAYLDGFIMSPSGAMVGTHSLFPIFSQSRVGGFNDILIPSPWHFDGKNGYEESEDVGWEEKTNGLFWRGSSSDGYAAFGSWAGFLRARFVHSAYQHSTSDPTLPIINVSFAGEISRCHQEDCAAQLENFSLWAQMTGKKSSTAESTLSSQRAPFSANWHFRHLIDMDGSGFSGRFLPFLQSRSLVYRAALFHAWFDERLSPWVHYIPVDVRLGESFWSVLRYFGKDEKGDAKRIAERGREWANKALRGEDMQVYMFRLLLEWGRVVDDDREYLRVG